jgi:hypothetical protein
MRWASPSATLGVVSHALPGRSSGFSLMMDALLGALPADKIATVGIGRSPWQGRAGFQLPIARTPTKRLESLVGAATIAAVRSPTPSFLLRKFPNVRRIFATLDPTLPVAASWARAAGAELWVYGIDLHASEFWQAGDFLRERLVEWTREALESASAAFGLSHRMAQWMRDHGARVPVEVLPPLGVVEAPAPLPEGPPMFLYCGWVYGANTEPLKWLERAVSDLAPAASLRLLTHTPAPTLARFGLSPERWSIANALPHQVAGEVAKATWGVVALDPAYPKREMLQVAWPTKLRDYLAVGRPVLTIAARDFAAAEMAERGGWGVAAASEAETREAVGLALATPRVTLEARAVKAHAYAREWMDNATVGARWRARAIA